MNPTPDTPTTAETLLALHRIGYRVAVPPASVIYRQLPAGVLAIAELDAELAELQQADARRREQLRRPSVAAPPAG